MNRAGALLSVCFCAGLLASLLTYFLLWVLLNWGGLELSGWSELARWQKSWVLGHIMQGGYWGLLFFLTVGSARSRKRWIRKGIWIGLISVAYQLFYACPYLEGKGFLAMDLGLTAPAVILVCGILWGFFTGIFSRLLWGR